MAPGGKAVGVGSARLLPRQIRQGPVPRRGGRTRPFRLSGGAGEVFPHGRFLHRPPRLCGIFAEAGRDFRGAFPACPGGEGRSPLLPVGRRFSLREGGVEGGPDRGSPPEVSRERGGRGGGGGPFAMFAGLRLGKDPFEMLNAPSSGETAQCGQEKEKLWGTIRGGTWSKEDAEKVRRAERLTVLGLVEYAILEAERVDRAAIRNATGLADGGTPGLFRYLSGDLRGAIRDTIGISPDPSTVGLIDRLQYPLAPQYLGDCDGKKSGVDSIVLHSIIRQEYLFQYNALSPAGAVGLMQLMPDD